MALPPVDAACCLHCAQLSEVVALAAAEASRTAVEAAFAELRPALLQVVARLGEERPSSDAQRQAPAASQSRRGILARLRHQGPERSAEPEGADGCPTLEWASEDRDATMRSPSLQSGRMRPVVSSQGGGEPSALSSEMSWKESPAASFFSSGRATVQSLQADIAMALLESSGYTTSVGSQRRAESETDRHTPTRQPAQAPGPLRAILPGEVEPCAQVSPHTALPGSPGGSLPTGAVSPPERGPSRSASRRLTGSQVLHQCIHELVAEASQGGGSRFVSEESRISSRLSRHFVHAPVPVVLRALGLVEWNSLKRPRASLAYQWVARAIIVLAAAASTSISLGYVAPPGGVLPGRCTPPCWQQVGFLSKVSLYAGAALALLPVGLRRQQRKLEETFWLVRGVSIERGYREWEAHQHLRDALVFLAIWLSTVAAAVLNDGLAPNPHEPSHIALRQCLTGVCCAVILGLTYGVVCICRSLIVMVDAFCCDIVGAKRLPEVAHVWNLTQAVLRKASTDLEACLLMMCMILAFSVPMFAADVAVLGVRGEDLPAFIPGLLTTCGSIYALMLAATVSEKCARVPALINAISFGPGTERARQHTVEYIKRSDAGFYVFDTRLTTTMVIKFMYAWCIVVVGLLTQLASSGT